MKGNMGGPPSEIYNQDEGEPGSPFSETPSSMERGSSERGFLFFLFYDYYWLHHMAGGILDPQPGMEPLPSALEVQSPHYWTVRECQKEISSEITFHCHSASHGLLRRLSNKESACQRRSCRRRGFDPWVGKILWGRKWQFTPVFLLG